MFFTFGQGPNWSGRYLCFYKWDLKVVLDASHIYESYFKIMFYMAYINNTMDFSYTDQGLSLLSNELIWWMGWINQPSYHQYVIHSSGLLCNRINILLFYSVMLAKIGIVLSMTGLAHMTINEYQNKWVNL